ncbi:MAG: hypothetical protein ACK56I_15660, partial [bacterium]
MLARDAAESMKQMLIPIFASDAIRRKYYGYIRVVIYIQSARFNVNMDINLHFFISVSKFFPYLPANKIAPSYPSPSFRT